MSEIFAEGNWQVAMPPRVIVNFTGTTPRLTLNTPEPSELMGCWTWAAYAGSKTAKGDNEGEVAQTVVVAVLIVVAS